MSNILTLCPKCQNSPATLQCIDCQEQMCYSCDQKVHLQLKQHQTNIIPYSQMKQIKSTSFILNDIKGNSNLSQKLLQELNELDDIIQTKKSFIIQQEQKWNTQISSLEIQYEQKLQQFEKEIESNENQFKSYYSSANTTTMIADIKKQMETQKQQAWKELNDKKAKLLEKEILLKEMISVESYCSQEIAQKEKLINEYKDFLQKQQAEKDLIKVENQKIMKQLEQIKNLCKKNLPEFGINVDFLDKLMKVNTIKNYEQVEEQDEEYEEDEEQQNKNEVQVEQKKDEENQNIKQQE